MKKERQAARLADDEHVGFWTLNLKHVNIIDMVAFALIIRLFVFPAMWSF